jgi:hypothetical protein
MSQDTSPQPASTGLAIKSIEDITTASTSDHSPSFPFLIITITKANRRNTPGWIYLVALMELSFFQGHKSRNL